MFSSTDGSGRRNGSCRPLWPAAPPKALLAGPTLLAAAACGRFGGHPKDLEKSDPKKREIARRMAQDPQTPVAQICQYLGISKWTFYHHFPPRERAPELSTDRGRLTSKRWAKSLEVGAGDVPRMFP